MEVNDCSITQKLRAYTVWPAILGTRAVPKNQPQFSQMMVGQYCLAQTSFFRSTQNIAMEFKKNYLTGFCTG